MRLIATLFCCLCCCAAQAQITAGPDPAPGNDCLSSTITLSYAGDVNGRSSYSFGTEYVISWTGVSWEFVYDGLFLLSYNFANTLEPPCSSVFPWISGLGCDMGQAPFIGGPACSSVVLAIELIDFKARVKDQTVTLAWTTAIEKNNATFSVERSAGAASPWENIGFVAGGGTTSAIASYTYTDDTPLAGLSFYRLKSIDFEGKEDLSKALSVYVKTGADVRVTPNPVQNVLTVTLSNTPLPASLLRIYNSVGQMVAEQPALEPYLEVDMSTFTAGLYWVEIASAQTTICRRVVIKN